MFKSFLLQRVMLPSLMLALLLLSLAYWWLGNVPHEAFGTGLFTFLCWHIYMNRTWFNNLTRGKYDARRAVRVLLHFGLIVNMGVLLVTSVVISKSVFAWLPIPDSVYLREIHWFAAYWVIIVTGIHVGLHWERLRTSLLNFLGVRQTNPVLRAVLLAMGAAFALQGTASFRTLGVSTKLTFNYSLDFWDFTASVTPFFGHWLAVFTLPAIITHVLMAIWRMTRRRHRGVEETQDRWRNASSNAANAGED
ncbi:MULTISPECIES: DUF4405 domain-containing protein [Rhizobium]|uniref:Transmembrane protein n=1 Tax=Rhizobium favelukesii TaxID=348824 RepID=W6RSI1_9HYPH|nr:MULTISPECIES: DUF4405 domain-containing protein [Rhizobium]MCS0461891.1 DUF4405 domain-containing protein [Rhizobium favelukesii]UFS79502.1 DUF4405 domain-containing protein [Rhizobium sp. T136]CDM63105.1 putative transmembrane protein [Rhizobium favelukesii]